MGDASPRGETTEKRVFSTGGIFRCVGKQSDDGGFLGRVLAWVLFRRDRGDPHHTRTRAHASPVSPSPPPNATMADPAIQELKRNAMILGAWLAAVRIVPYVCHALQSKN